MMRIPNGNDFLPPFTGFRAPTSQNHIWSQVACGPRGNPRINMDRAANYWWKNMVYNMEYHFMFFQGPLVINHGCKIQKKTHNSTQFLDFGPKKWRFPMRIPSYRPLIWINFNISLPWILRPFGDDFPQINHDSRFGRSEVVIIYPDRWW